MFVFIFLFIFPIWMVPFTSNARMQSEVSIDYVTPESSYLKRGLTSFDIDTHSSLDYTKYLQAARDAITESNFESAINWYYKALKIADETVEKNEMYGVLLGLNIKIGNYQEAIRMHLLEVANAIDSSTIASSKLDISNVYVLIGDYRRAEQLLNEAILYFEQQKDTVMLSFGIMVQATLLRSNKSYHEALERNIKAYDLISEWLSKNENFHKDFNKIEYNLAIVLNNIADIYILLGLPDSAIHYLNRICAHGVNIPKDLKAAISISYGQAWTLKGQINKALHNFKLGLEIANSLSLQDILSTAYKAMSLLYSKKGEYKLAWQFQQKYFQLNETLLSKESIHKMHRHQIEYAIAKKDKELAEQELLYNQNQLKLIKENNLIYLLLLSGGFSSVLLIIYLRNLYNKQRFLKAEIKNTEQKNHILQVEATLTGEENERERIAKELHDSVVSELLVMRINLKNIVSKHRQLLFSEDCQNLLHQSEEITEKLRSATHNMMPVRLKEMGLIKTIEAFIRQINIPKLHISFQSYGQAVRLKDATEKIILMITHELVQNIIKHAKADEAIVQLNYFEDIFCLTVEDNGVGLHVVQDGNKDGVGWENIKKNITILKAHLDIKSSEHKGTTIHIELPLAEHTI